MAKKHSTSRSKVSRETGKSVRRAIEKSNPVKEPPTVGKPVIIDAPEDKTFPIVRDAEKKKSRSRTP
jgi:hypothetical protein